MPESPLQLLTPESVFRSSHSVFAYCAQLPALRLAELIAPMVRLTRSPATDAHTKQVCLPAVRAGFQFCTWPVNLGFGFVSPPPLSGRRSWCNCQLRFAGAHLQLWPEFRAVEMGGPQAFRTDKPLMLMGMEDSCSQLDCKALTDIEGSGAARQSIACCPLPLDRRDKSDTHLRSFCFSTNAASSHTLSLQVLDQHGSAGSSPGSPGHLCTHCKQTRAIARVLQ